MPALDRLPLLDHLEPPLPTEIRDNNPFRTLARQILDEAQQLAPAVAEPEEDAEEAAIEDDAAEELAEDVAETPADPAIIGAHLDGLLDTYHLIVRRLPDDRAERVAAVAEDLAESDDFWNTPPLDRFPLVPTWMKGERVAALRGESLLEAMRADYDPDGRIWATRTLGKKYGLTRGRIHQLIQAAARAREANGLPA